MTVFAVTSFTLISCGPSQSSNAPKILLFDGEGVSVNDVAAIGKLLKAKHLEYSLVNAPRLNDMSESNFLSYRLLIVPGGNYLTMSSGLTPVAATNIHNAVANGLNYLGICAGGLLAGNASSNSFNLTDGVRVGFYSVVNRGIHKAAVPIACAGLPAVEHYWEDGPQFTGWGEVVGRYPDETPAVVEGTCGKGWVILCGTHPEAPDSWRRGLNFTTSTKSANAFAGTLIDSALSGTPLPHY